MAGMRESVRWPAWLLAVFTLLGLVACGGDREAAVPAAVTGEGAVARIDGTVFYRERMLLPPGFEVVVQLEDISRADAMAAVLASVVLTPEGAPPYSFAIEYDPSVINPRLRYALRATINSGEQMMFTSTEHMDPFGSRPLDIMVQRVPEAVNKLAR